MVVYFFLFFILTLPSLFDYSEWQSFSPLRWWLFLSGVFVWMALSYYVWVSFVLWIESELSGKIKCNG